MTRKPDPLSPESVLRTEPDLHLALIAESLRVVAIYRGTDRGTDLAMATIALTEEFAQSPIQNRIWNQFLNRERLAAPALAEVMVEVRSFMGPLHKALAEDHTADRVWNMETHIWG